MKFCVVCLPGGVRRLDGPHVCSCGRQRGQYTSFPGTGTATVSATDTITAIGTTTGIATATANATGTSTTTGIYTGTVTDMGTGTETGYWY